MPESLARRRILVTGGAGFIGSHLVERAVAQGAFVRVLDDFSTGSRVNLSAIIDRIEIVEGSIGSPAVCSAAMHDIEYVLHCAAVTSVDLSLQQPARTIDVNVSGTCNVLGAAREAKVTRVVYASSSSVYGTGVPAPQREGHEGTVQSPYALSKAMSEQLAELFYRCFGLSAVGLRFFNVYGPRQSPTSSYAAVIPTFLQALRDGRPLSIHGTGGQTRDFVHVADVAEVVLSALTTARATTGVYNVGTGTATSIRELAEAVCGLRVGASELRYGPGRADDIAESRADQTRFEQVFGKRDWISMREGLRLTADELVA